MESQQFVYSNGSVGVPLITTRNSKFREVSYDKLVASGGTTPLSCAAKQAVYDRYEARLSMHPEYVPGPSLCQEYTPAPIYEEAPASWDTGVNQSVRYAGPLPAVSMSAAPPPAAGCQYVQAAPPRPVVPLYEEVLRQQPVYQVPYVQPMPQPQPQFTYAVAPPTTRPKACPKIVFVGPAARPSALAENIIMPLESDIVCRGHPHDRREVCFGCSIPPRQLKFDLIRVETSGFLGLGICKGQRIKAVCRKCRVTLPACRTCGKQSAIEHP